MKIRNWIIGLLLFGGTAYGVKQVNTADIANLAVTNAKIAASTIDLTAKVTGTLPAANGGTGQTSVANAFTSFYEAVATTLGDVIYGGASGAPTRLAGNTTTTPKFLKSLGSGGLATAPTFAQPACGDLSNAATSCSTDTTNASNITSGTLPAGQLPSPSSSTLGGIRSYAAVSNQWINAISTSGVPSSTQPAFTDISGTATASQLPAPAAAALAALDIDWSLGKNKDYLYTKTLSASSTLTFSNVTAGETIVIAITNTASNYTVTWPAAAKWPAGTAPTETVGAKTDVITCKSYDGTNAYCSSVQNF